MVIDVLSTISWECGRSGAVSFWLDSYFSYSETYKLKMWKGMHLAVERYLAIIIVMPMQLTSDGCCC